MEETTKKRKGPNLKEPLNENVMHHLDSLYRAARRDKNFNAAFKAIELCLKAKNMVLKGKNALLSLAEFGDSELEQALMVLAKDIEEDI